VDYLPLFAEWKERPVLVVGGGEIILVVGEVVQLHQQFAWFQHTTPTEGFSSSVVNLA
jgi:hypothetical protein